MGIPVFFCSRTRGNETRRAGVDAEELDDCLEQETKVRFVATVRAAKSARERSFLSRHRLVSVISNQTWFLRHVLDGLMVIQRAARRDDEVTVKGTMPAKDSMAAPS
jgi:hypothetical protein